MKLEAGERFDRAIQRALHDAGRAVSVREVRNAIRAGTIRVNGRRTAPGERAAGEELVDVSAFIPRAEASITAAPEISAAVLYEDEFLLALDKPSGVPALPLAPGEPGTLLGAAVARCPQIEAAGPPLEGGAVHRLDTGTSGIVVFAKDASTRARLRAAFSSGGVEKRYWAIVDGAFADQVIEAPLSGRGALVRVDPTGLPARTELRVVERDGDRALVEACMRTGRRHQIRAHLASVGAPICGDGLYGGSAAPRLMLHAHLLQVPEGPEICSPIPDEMGAFLHAK